MPCPHCGSQIEPSDRFCASCGHELAAACPACGAQLRPNSRFCAACGAPVAGATTAASPSARAPVRPPPPETIDFLRKPPVFQFVEAEALAHLAGRMRPLSVPEGPIFKEGDPPNGFYVIVSGAAKVTKSTGERGQEAVLAILRRGDCFGEVGLLDGLPRTAAVIAMQPLECYFLEQEGFLAALQEDPGLARGVLQALASMVRRADDWVGRNI